MSATYRVNGYVDVRINIVDRGVHASSSASPADIAEIVKIQVTSHIGNCWIVDHKLMIEE